MNVKDKLECKNIDFKNRLIMPPMAIAKAEADGYVTEQILEYYSEKTKNGGFSAVIVEHNYVDAQGKAHNGQMSVAEDGAIAGLKKLAQVIKKNGSKAILQISHGGSMCKSQVTGQEVVAPSPVISPTGRNDQLPKELTVEEIKSIKEKFVKAADRAKEAGFDGVELHSAHGYLLDQFLSPLSNKRQDEYGGNILNRIKIHLEIIKAIKEQLGSNYPLFIRIGAGDFMDGGLEIEDTIMAAKEFEKAGVDVIDISGGMCFYTIEDKSPGYFQSITKPVFDNVSIPVILTGGIKTGDDVKNILKKNTCDLVGVGRAVLNNSNWIIEEIG